MNKLEYDNLYKFLVSLGLVMIAFPVIIFAYLINKGPILISHQELDSLSDISQKMISDYFCLINILKNFLPWIAGISITLGIAFVIGGFYKWKQIQKSLDRKLNAETTIQTLNALQMNQSEIDNKIKSEISASHNPISPNADNKKNSSNKISNDVIHKYREIENYSFNYALSQYGEKYRFTRNVKMGKYEFDFIGVSKTDNIDLLFDIKYYSNYQSLIKLQNICEKDFGAGSNYKNIAHRNFKILILIIAPKSEILIFKSKIKNQLDQIYSQYGNHIQIQCISEDDL